MLRLFLVTLLTLAPVTAAFAQAPPAPAVAPAPLPPPLTPEELSASKDELLRQCGAISQENAAAVRALVLKVQKLQGELAAIKAVQPAAALPKMPLPPQPKAPEPPK